MRSADEVTSAERARFVFLSSMIDRSCWDKGWELLAALSPYVRICHRQWNSSQLRNIIDIWMRLFPQDSSSYESMHCHGNPQTECESSDYKHVLDFAISWKIYSIVNLMPLMSGCKIRVRCIHINSIENESHCIH